MINNAIEERAERLLMDSGNFKLPIDVKKCAEYLNVVMHEIDLEEGISGFLAINGKNAQIGYNKNHSTRRQRFTISHEIGHYILHAQSEPLFIDKKNEQKISFLFRDDNSASGEYIKEREANNFAAALLMPRILIQQELEKCDPHDKFNNIVTQLSKKFNVSPQAMNIRLTNLGYSDYDTAF